MVLLIPQSQRRHHHPHRRRHHHRLHRQLTSISTIILLVDLIKTRLV